jgi:hypothetical protein
MIQKLSQDYKSICGLPVISFVDTEIFTMRYPETGCLEMGCRDVCCSGGAIMDYIHFNKLRKTFGSTLPVSIDWDSFHFIEDPYYPGGMGCYTLFDNNRCMFQREEGAGCIIHAHCIERGIDFREYKFFTCCFFPCEVNTVGLYQNVLTPGYELRYPEFDLPCKKGGRTTVYEKAKEDITYYFGPILIEELETYKETIVCEVKG